MRSRSRDEEEEEQFKRRQLQEDHLSKVMGLAHVHKTFIIIMEEITEIYRDWTYFAKWFFFLLFFFYNTTDPVWSWEANFKGRDGKGNEQGEICSQCGRPAVRVSAH